MLAEADDVLEQARVIQRRATVLHRHAAPVRLAGDRAVGLEQMAVHALLDNARIIATQQFRPWMLVVADADIQFVDAHARQGHDAFALDILETANAHPHRLAGSRRQVLGQRRLKARGIGKRRLVQGVEIELERLRLDDVRRIRRNAEFADRHHRLARRQQPGQLEAVPEVHAFVRQGLSRQAQLRPLRGARDREQQGRRVGGDVFAGLAQRRVFGCGMHGGNLTEESADSISLCSRL
ncbi:hypothetical protein D9M71_504870 [compost metagenome]